ARGQVEHLDDSPIPGAHDAVGDVAVRPADADEDTVPRGGYLVDRDAERVPSLSDVLEDGLGLGAVRSGRRAAPPQAAALDPTPVDVRIEQCGQSVDVAPGPRLEAVPDELDVLFGHELSVLVPRTGRRGCRGRRARTTLRTRSFRPRAAARAVGSPDAPAR